MSYTVDLNNTNDPNANFSAPLAAPNTTNNNKSTSLTTPSPSLTSLNATGTNPLHKYQTYNSLFTLAVLTPEQQNSGRFSAPEIRNIICSTKGDWRYPSKRASTSFGSYDYWIDDLMIVSQPAFSPATGNAFANLITFKVTEPYSMGLFMLTCKEAAGKAGYPDNFQTAPYLLMIEFAGYVNEQPQIDPKLTRYIPIHIIKMDFKVTAAGTVYDVEAVPYNEIAFRDNAARTLSDFVLSGKDVKSLLTESDRSLKVALEKQLLDVKKQRTLSSTDEYRIIFPNSWESKTDDGNAISKSIVFNDLNDSGTVPFPDYNKVFNANKKILELNRVNVSPDKTFHFPQSIKIQDIIQEVIIRSRYITDQIEGNTIKTDSRGFVNWFRIEAHVEDLTANQQLNRQNRRYIIRVLPYKVHISRLNPPDKETPNIQNLRNSVSRTYKYIYTGQNTDIIDINLEFNQSWYVPVPFDVGRRTGTNNANQGGIAAGGGEASGGQPTALPPGRFPETGPTNRIDISPVQDPSSVTPNKIIGGAGNDSEKTAQTRFLISRIANEGDLINLDMTIHGDPYYLPSSGMGNQIMSKLTDTQLDDGSMNYQDGEVHILIQFRTPIDLDPETGLYKFDKELDIFSGLYMILQVESKFIKNNFTQVLTLIKLRNEYGSGKPTNPIAEPLSSGSARPGEAGF